MTEKEGIDIFVLEDTIKQHTKFPKEIQRIIIKYVDRVRINKKKKNVLIDKLDYSMHDAVREMTNHCDDYILVIEDKVSRINKDIIIDSDIKPVFKIVKTLKDVIKILKVCSWYDPNTRKYDLQDNKYHHNMFMDDDYRSKYIGHTDNIIECELTQNVRNISENEYCFTARTVTIYNVTLPCFEYLDKNFMSKEKAIRDFF